MARRSSIGPTPRIPGLELCATKTGERALLRQRARLLKDVQKKKRQLEQLGQNAAREAEDVVVRMAPLVARHRALVAELTAIFDELLAEGRLSVRARRQVAKVRRTLEFQGLLSPIGESAQPEAGGFWEDEVQRPGHDQGRPGPRGRRRQDARHGSPEETLRREVASAEQPDKARRSLRDIFRNLARAVHPDRAEQAGEGERARRTEVMKEITRAYEQGDLARLLELEGIWQSHEPTSAAADAEGRCRELERINRELLDQSRELTKKLRDLKRETLEACLGRSPDQLVLRAGRELRELEGICEFFRRFKDGKITLAELPLAAIAQ